MSNKTHILIVDDNIINRQYFSMALNKSGYPVALAENGFEAIKIAQQAKFDVILMDIRMPDMDGYETTQRIRSLSNHQHTPIIATSAENISDERKLLFCDFALKPISPKQLEGLIQKHCSDCVAQIMIFNQNNSMKFAYNDKKIMKKLIALFVKELPLLSQQLHTSLSNSDQQASKDLIHKIRGSCKACGADALDKKLMKLSNNLNAKSGFSEVKSAIDRYLLAVINLTE